MSKKLAVLIGVSRYQFEAALPPCENDLNMMTNIIRGAGKFDDYIILGNSPKGGDAKSEIASFIRKYQNQKVEEVFFYYSGHGTRYAGDFLFAFSDFNKDKIEQTSLRNSELDTMLKSLSPELAVKVVDACQAGTEYIKSGEELEDIFKKSASSSFNKTYFFFSCTSTESAIAVKDYSLFTKSFADAIVSYSGKAVRYRDLAAYISDDKTVTSRQTPLFIQQAHNIEVFCDVSDDLLKSIKGVSEESSEVPSGEETPTVISPFESRLIDMVKTKALDYCNEEEAQSSLAVMIKTITEHNFGEILTQLYGINAEMKKSYTGITGVKAVGSWLSEEKDPYFAKVTYTTEEYEAQERVEVEEDYGGLFSATSMVRMIGRPRKYETKNVTRYRDVVDGFQLTATTPCCAIEIVFSPKEQILPWYKAFVIFVFSKSKLVIFYKYEKEREINWSHRETQNNQQWKTIQCSLKNHDGIISSALSIMTKVSEGIVTELSASFDVPIT